MPHRHRHAERAHARRWDFLRSYATGAERYVFTREAYLWEGLDHDRLRVIPPAIDAIAPKNRAISDEDVVSILGAEGSSMRRRTRRPDVWCARR